jgi:hypothetical protein
MWQYIKAILPALEFDDKSPYLDMKEWGLKLFDA